MQQTQARTTRLAVLSSFIAAASLMGGCDDGAEPSGGGGSGGSGGNDGSILEPTSYLQPNDYDCTAAGPFEPPERPHPGDCFASSACTSRLVTAHRIATPFAPENSLSALRAAILLGVDIVETDLRLTADDEVVFIHDSDVDRTFDGTGSIDELTLAEIRAMDMHVPPGLPPGDFSCDRAPTLDEVFALSAGRIVLDLDVKDVEAGVLAAEYMSDHDLFGDAYLLCSRDKCETIRAAVPNAPIMSRPTIATEVAAEIQYTPAPVMVHIDHTEPFLASEILDLIHGVGAKAFANAMSRADVEAMLTGRIEAYGEMYDDGLDVVQVEFPHLALLGLGRLQPTTP